MDFGDRPPRQSMDIGERPPRQSMDFGERPSEVFNGVSQDIGERASEVTNGVPSAIITYDQENQEIKPVSQEAEPRISEI